MSQSCSLSVPYERIATAIAVLLVRANLESPDSGADAPPPRGFRATRRRPRNGTPRSLRDDLRSLDGAEIAFADGIPTSPGAKGPGLSPEIVLVVTVGSAALRTVTTAIHAWAERSSRRKLRLSCDGAKEVIEIQGGIGPDEARIIQEWSKRRSS